jgi:hypothetical protein
MLAALDADVEVLLEFEGVDEGPTIWTFHPEALGHIFTSIKAAEAGFAENAHGNWKVAVWNKLPRRKARERDASGREVGRQSPFDGSAPKGVIFGVAISRRKTDNLPARIINITVILDEYSLFCKWFVAPSRRMARSNVSQRSACPKVSEAGSKAGQADGAARRERTA